MSSKHRVPLRRDGPPIPAVRPGPQHPRIAFGDLRCIDGSWWASTSEFKAGRSRQPLCLAKVHRQPPLPHIPCSQIGSAEALRIQDLHSARSSSALCLRSCCHAPIFHSLVRGRLNLRRALDILAIALPAQVPLPELVWFDLGFLLSQTLLDVSFLDQQLLAELQQAFQPGELFSFRISSFPTFTVWLHRAPWQLLDVGAGLKVASGHVSADETFAFDDSGSRESSESSAVPLLETSGRL